MEQINSKAISKKEFIDIRFFFQRIKSKLKINICSDESGFDRKITEQNLNRPGLALSGFVDLFSHARVQLFGNTEVQYLNSLSKEKRLEAIERVFRFDIPCVIFTDNNIPEDDVINLANQFHIPVFTTPFNTTEFVYLLSDFLNDQFALRASIHGSFVDVYGIGIVFIGKSGIGKSEVALDLIERGHRLVADDIIILTKKGEGILMGSGTNLVKHFMEIRGLGLIDVERMFGIRAIRYQKRLEIIVELEVWNDKEEYTRTGLDGNYETISDVEIPYVKLPILPGKNITVISEVISLNYLLKHFGYDAAAQFQNTLNKRLKGENIDKIRGVEYFEHDFE